MLDSSAIIENLYVQNHCKVATGGCYTMSTQKVYIFYIPHSQSQGTRKFFTNFLANLV